MLAVVLAFSSGRTTVADVEGAIVQIEQFKAGDSTAILNESLAEIRSKMVVGDTEIWRRLRAIVENPEMSLGVRGEVLLLASEKANESIARDMLMLFDSWSRQLAISDSIPQTVNSAKADARILLLGQFVHSLQEDSWRHWLGNDSRRYEFLERVILRTTPGMNVHHDAFAALTASGDNREMQKAVAERLVAASPRATEHDSRLLELLDDSSCDRLRVLVKESDEVDQFHFGAAAALAHLGDGEARSVLESLKPEFQEADRIGSGILDFYLWQIDVQHPQEKLIAYIRQEPRYDVEKRKWAIRRAVQLDLPKRSIREAVLQHAGLVRVDDRTGTRQGLSSIKSLCIELKILGAGDLPEVGVAQEVPTP